MGDINALERSGRDETGPPGQGRTGQDRTGQARGSASAWSGSCHRLRPAHLTLRLLRSCKACGVDGACAWAASELQQKAEKWMSQSVNHPEEYKSSVKSSRVNFRWLWLLPWQPGLGISANQDACRGRLTLLLHLYVVLVQAASCYPGTW